MGIRLNIRLGIRFNTNCCSLADGGERKWYRSAAYLAPRGTREVRFFDPFHREINESEWENVAKAFGKTGLAERRQLLHDPNQIQASQPTATGRQSSAVEPRESGVSGPMGQPSERASASDCTAGAGSGEWGMPGRPKRPLTQTRSGVAASIGLRAV